MPFLHQAAFPDLTFHLDPALVQTPQNRFRLLSPGPQRFLASQAPKRAKLFHPELYRRRPDSSSHQDHSDRRPLDDDQCRPPEGICTALRGNLGLSS